MKLKKNSFKVSYSFPGTCLCHCDDLSFSGFCYFDVLWSKKKSPGRRKWIVRWKKINHLVREDGLHGWKQLGLTEPLVGAHQEFLESIELFLEIRDCYLIDVYVHNRNFRSEPRELGTKAMVLAPHCDISTFPKSHESKVFDVRTYKIICMDLLELMVERVVAKSGLAGPP